MDTHAVRPIPAKESKGEAVTPQYKAFRDLLRKVIKPSPKSLALRHVSSDKG